MELIISKEKDSFINLLCVLIIILAVALIILLYNFAGVIAFAPAPFILFAGGLFARYLYISYNKVEFEYVVSAGILNIDKILNQSKRLPIVKITVSDILSFGEYTYDDKNVYKMAKEAVKFIDCGNGNEESLHYYFTCNYENRGIHMYVITPDNKFLTILKGGNSVINKALMLDKK